MSSVSIALVGHVCIDHNVIHGVASKTWGSALMYTNNYFAKHYANVQTTALAPYGQDFEPYRGSLDLYPRSTQHDHTLVFKNIVAEDGARGQQCFYTEFATPVPPDDYLPLQSANILYVAPLTNQFDTAYVLDLINRAPREALKVLVPQGYFRDIDVDGMVKFRPFHEAADIIPLFDLVVLSDDDTLDAIECARAWKQQSPTTNIIVTMNVDGAMIIGIDPASDQHIPTIPIDPTDVAKPIGNGDIFTAVTAYHYHLHGDLAAAIAAAHQAARENLLAA